MSDPSTPMAGDAGPGPGDSEGWDWAVVEIFGHRKLAGRTREEERFGARMLRIDVPNQGDPVNRGWTTCYYGGSALFSFTPADEATVLRLNRPYAPAARYALAAPTLDADEDDPGDDEERLG